MAMYQFWVAGKPATKGSTKSFRHSKTGKIVTMSTCGSLKGWERNIAAEARRFIERPCSGPVSVSLNFRFIGGAKWKTKFYYCPRRRYDIDKLARAALDGLSGVAYLDDSQVVTLFVTKYVGYQDGVAIAIATERENLKRKEV